MNEPEVKFQGEIECFQAADRQSPPARNGVLFVGDSDIRLWTTDGEFDRAFRGLPALNRGFGGARTWEVVEYFSRIVEPYRPRAIVYCCGDNDVSCLREAGGETAVRGFSEFLDQVRKGLPETKKVFYLAIHPAPVIVTLWDVRERVNARIEQICAASGLAEFVDYLHLLRDGQGRLQPEHFRQDGLHFSTPFYRTLAAFLGPRLDAQLERTG